MVKAKVTNFLNNVDVLNEIGPKGNLWINVEGASYPRLAFTH